MYYANLCLDYNLKNKNIDRLINNYISLSEIYYEQNPEKCMQMAQRLFSRYLDIKWYTLAHSYIRISDAFF